MQTLSLDSRVPFYRSGMTPRALLQHFTTKCGSIVVVPIHKLIGDLQDDLQNLNE